MNRTYPAIIFTALLFLNLSCIDRDTIAGSGKEVPDSMTGAGGNFQSGTIRSQLPLPLRVRVLASNGNPVRGVIVEFSNPQGRVSFSDTTAISDGDGYASTKVTLGTTADSVKVYATVIGLKGSPVLFSLLARASSEARAEKFSGDLQSGIVTGQLSSPIKIQVFDPYNNTVKGVTTIFSTSHGSFSPAVVQSDSNGFSSSVWKLDSLAGTKSAVVSFPTLPSVTLQFSATALAHTPATMFALTNDSIYSLEGIQVPGGIQVKMVDKYGNPTPGHQVQFSATVGSPAIGLPVALTGSTGIASTSITLGYGDSVAKVRAVSPQFSLPQVDFTFFQYVYLQIDSLRSSGGLVDLFWEKNLNSGFKNYTLERCSSYAFDQTTIIVAVITDENVTSVTDNTASVNSSPFYRIKVNYTNGFYFHTNIRQVTVSP